jgi:hypothetical protein
MQSQPDFDAIQTALRVLNVTKSAYPAILVVLFIVAFLAHSVKNAPDDGGKVQIHAMKGPGGRPLPTRRKSANQVKAAAQVKDFPYGMKMVIRFLQAGIILTFLVNAAVIIFETLLNRKEQWWSGQSTVVSGDDCHAMFLFLSDDFARSISSPRLLSG